MTRHPPTVREISVFIGLIALLASLSACRGESVESRNEADSLLVEVTEANLEVGINGTASVRLKMLPDTVCVLCLEYASGWSQAADLKYPKRVDEGGTVYWDWKIPPGAAPGRQPFTIMCSLGTLATAIELELIISGSDSAVDGEI